jgi:hypothetical protein
VRFDWNREMVSLGLGLGFGEEDEIEM